MFASLRLFGAVLASLALALTAGSSSAWAGTLTRDQTEELRLYDAALVVARPGAGPALRRAGGVKIATALPVWRVPSRSALRVLPGLVRDGLVGDLSVDQPLSTFVEPFEPQEWWIPVVRANQAVPPGPGRPLTVIDSGVDLAHEEFAARPSTLAMNVQTTSAQHEEHGTAVASVAAAPVNNLGVVGIYPQAALQVWDASPFGDGLSVADVVQGLDVAIRRGQGVVNLSLGAPSRNSVLEAMVAVTVGSGTLVVAAAGNSRDRGNPREYPASLPHVLTVGALDRSGAPAYFSSGSQHLDLAAPGVDIPVAVPTTLHPPSFYEPAGFSGTSFAAPLVSGAAAWVWTVRPTLDVTQLFEVMRASAQDVSSPGYDTVSGFGRLDVPTALTVAPPARDPQEPNEDVVYVKPRGLLRPAPAPLTVAGKRSGAVNARLDLGDDPRDVYRFWIPGRRAASIALQPSGGDVDLAAWGPLTRTVFEGGSARKRDFRGLSERNGMRRERLRVRNRGSKGAYFYVEASVGAGGGSAARKVAGLKYGLAVSIVRPRAARR
jgi:subtilisin family serine protease